MFPIFILFQSKLLENTDLKSYKIQFPEYDKCCLHDLFFITLHRTDWILPERDLQLVHALHNTDGTLKYDRVQPVLKTTRDPIVKTTQNTAKSIKFQAK